MTFTGKACLFSVGVMNDRQFGFVYILGTFCLLISANIEAEDT